MALTATDKKEIEILIRKEVKDFLGSNTMSQYERKLIDLLKKEIGNGNLTTSVSEVVSKVMKEFYKIMWTRRSFWEPTLKNVK